MKQSINIFIERERERYFRRSGVCALWYLAPALSCHSVHSFVHDSPSLSGGVKALMALSRIVTLP